MHINNIVKYVLCVLAGVILGGGIFYFRSGRGQSQHIAELERNLTEQEHRIADLNKRNDCLIRQLHEHSERAAELIDSMGDQLGRDHIALLSTTELIRALRTQMQDLEDYYNYISTSDDRLTDMGSN